MPTILIELEVTSGAIGSFKKKYYYSTNAQILAQDLPGTAGPGSFDRYFYLHDRLGSVKAVLDSAGNIANYYTYTPFGDDLVGSGPLPEYSETVSNPWKFTGQWFDAEINQYYLRARQYDPYLARFTTRDPIKGKYTEPLTLHAYLYCLNDPVNRYDLNGEFSLGEIMSGTSIRAALTKGGINASLKMLDAFGDGKSLVLCYR